MYNIMEPHQVAQAAKQFDTERRHVHTPKNAETGLNLRLDRAKKARNAYRENLIDKMN